MVQSQSTANTETATTQRNGFSKRYRVNEVFLSVQGEGIRAGTVNVFVRFAGCNLTCNKLEHGFDCDTEWSGGIDYTARELVDKIDSVANGCKWIVWTGGEPALQLDDALLLATGSYQSHVETNGTQPLPKRWLMDYLAVSPKTAAHTLKCAFVNEVRYVIHEGQALPKRLVPADHYFVSPAFEANGQPTAATVEWCLGLVKANPVWKLSLQWHKLIGIR